MNLERRKKTTKDENVASQVSRKRTSRDILPTADRPVTNTKEVTKTAELKKAPAYGTASTLAKTLAAPEHTWEDSLYWRNFAEQLSSYDPLPDDEFLRMIDHMPEYVSEASTGSDNAKHQPVEVQEEGSNPKIFGEPLPPMVAAVEEEPSHDELASPTLENSNNSSPPKLLSNSAAREDDLDYLFEGFEDFETTDQQPPPISIQKPETSLQLGSLPEVPTTSEHTRGSKKSLISHEPYKRKISAAIDPEIEPKRTRKSTDLSREFSLDRFDFNVENSPRYLESAQLDSNGLHRPISIRASTQPRKRSHPTTHLISTYPDPSENVLNPDSRQENQAYELPQPPNPDYFSQLDEPERQRVRSRDNTGSVTLQHPGESAQKSPVIERSQTHDIVGKSIRHPRDRPVQSNPSPRSTFQKTRPTQPGPGGPGTWPGDWIELNFVRGHNKYPQPFPKGTDKIPGGYELWVYCFFFPNHVWGAGLDPFLDAGWGGRDMWNNFADEAREACRKNGEFVPRPWNFLQQALSRRKKERDGEIRRQSNHSNDTDGRLEQSPRIQPASKSRSRSNKTPQTAAVLAVPMRGPQAPPNSDPNTHDLCFDPSQHVISSDGASKPGLRLHQHNSAAEPWWQDVLRRQAHRLADLQRQVFQDFARLPPEAQVESIKTSLRTYFDRFVKSIWPQIPQILVHRLPPMGVFSCHLPPATSSVFCTVKRGGSV